MYIKSVTVCNFKSYKDSISIDLSPECNVVVGRNGAGKSNLRGIDSSSERATAVLHA